MESIIIKARGHMPYIEFNADGKLVMEGRSIPEDVNRMFDPLIDFVTKLNVEKAIFNIDLEYFNTATSKKLLELMKHLESNYKISNVDVNWHFDEGDEDSVEMAEIYEECLLRTQFTYFEKEVAI